MPDRRHRPRRRARRSDRRSDERAVRRASRCARQPRHGRGVRGYVHAGAGRHALSSAAFLTGPPTPLTIRFSNAGGVPDAAGHGPSVGRPPRHGDQVSSGRRGENDIVAMSANSFPVATGEDFLASAGCRRQRARRPQTHPGRAVPVQPPGGGGIRHAPRPVAVSYGTESFFGVNAQIHQCAGRKQVFGRYRIVPESGPAYVSDDEAAKRPGTALADNLRAAVEKGSVKFRLLVQLAAPGDPTADATKVWPDSRPTIELGEIRSPGRWTPRGSRTGSCSCRPT